MLELLTMRYDVRYQSPSNRPVRSRARAFPCLSPIVGREHRRCAIRCVINQPTDISSYAPNSLADQQSRAIVRPHDPPRVRVASPSSKSVKTHATSDRAPPAVSGITNGCNRAIPLNRLRSSLPYSAPPTVADEGTAK